MTAQLGGGWVLGNPDSGMCNGDGIWKKQVFPLGVGVSHVVSPSQGTECPESWENEGRAVWQLCLRPSGSSLFCPRGPELWLLP